MEGNISIDIANERDAQSLLEIYSYYVKNTAITFEYDVPSLYEFKNRITKTLEKYPYIVAKKDDRILGYAYAGAFKSRDAYDWAVETSIYVHNDFKKSGIGRLLYNSLEDILKKQNILNMYACIAVTEVDDSYLNNDSLYFHQSMGYKLAGKLKKCGYKFSRWYDMVWMEKFIGEHYKNTKAVKWFSQIDFSGGF